LVFYGLPFCNAAGCVRRFRECNHSAPFQGNLYADLAIEPARLIGSRNNRFSILKTGLGCLTTDLRKSSGKAVMPGPQEARDLPWDSPTQQRRSLDDLFSLVYEELRRLASFIRKNEPGATLSSTALVHEAWLKLRDSPHLAATSPPHFKAIAAKAMRQVLVDEARRRSAQKRGGSGQAAFFTLDDSPEQVASCDEEILALDKALDELAGLNPRHAQMVESRFFAGLSVAETAAELGVSESSVERDWRAAKAWLASRIRAGRE
jgi:RNA polymerase sigma factor (TIGR02999 family)